MENLRKLHSDGLTNSEISKMTGIDPRRVSERLKKLGLRRNERMVNTSVTQLQHEVFISMTIGDGSIFKGQGNKNYRMNLAHCEAQKEYFLEKYEIIRDFIQVDYKFHEGYDKRTGKCYPYYKIQTKTNPYFTGLRERFYEDGKKIIPLDLLRDITPRVLAYKFFDDGYDCPGRGYCISMNDYDEVSLKNFSTILLERFGIETTVHSAGITYIPLRFREYFKELVIPYATSDVLYKLGEFMGTPSD